MNREKEEEYFSRFLFFFFFFLLTPNGRKRKRENWKKEKGDKLPSFFQHSKSTYWIEKDRRNNYLSTVGCLNNKIYIIQVQVEVFIFCTIVYIWTIRSISAVHFKIDTRDHTCDKLRERKINFHGKYPINELTSSIK